jgi:hypothetical protein
VDEVTRRSFLVAATASTTVPTLALCENANDVCSSRLIVVEYGFSQSLSSISSKGLKP